MLVLSRMLEESIYIDTSDGRITIKVCEFRRCGEKGMNVKLGFTAPRSITITRDDVKRDTRRPDAPC